MTMGPDNDNRADASASDEVNEKIGRAKRQLEQMIDLAPQIMLLMTPDGTVIRANKPLLQLLELEGFGDVLGKRLQDLFSCEDEGFFDDLLAQRSGYAAREVEATPGRARVRSLLFTVIGRESDAESFVVVVHDVTEEKAKQREAEQSHKSEAVRALMGALMHHLNQPLTVIMVRAKLLSVALEKGDIDPAEMRKTMQDIMGLAMDMAETLKRVEEAEEFSTEPYLEGLDIMDIVGEGGAKAG
jgi:signal transduction histidine kinase